MKIELDKIKNMTNLWINKNYPQIFLFIEQINIGLSWKEKLFIHINNLEKIPKCYCGNNLLFISLTKGYREFCSKKCSASSTIIADKRKKTCVIKYGSENPMGNNEVKEKLNAKILQKYGVTNISKLEQTKEKVRITNNQKFGYDYISQIPEVRQKLSKNLSERKEAMTILKRKKIDLYIVEKIKNYDINFISAFFSDYKFLCNKCSTIFDIHKNMLNDRIKHNVTLCTVCNKIKSGSDAQEQIINYLKEKYTGIILKNDRKTINGELDIYLPELNLAIEYNGIYWHSIIYKEENYHMNKTKMCIEKNIKLIHIWEDEWINNKEIILSRLDNIIGISKKIYARKCSVRNLSTDEYRNFMNINHLQGFVGAKYKFGLFYNDELVSVMSVGELRKNLGFLKTDGVYELLRYANKINFTVIGGASKLLSFFQKNYYCKKMISYADIGWSNGNLYEKLGFSKVKTTKPNYFYVKNGIRYDRFTFRKDILVKNGEDITLTEAEIMKKNGYYKIFNCGNYKYEINF